MKHVKFSTWCEARESDEAIKAAVIDAIPEDLRSTIHDEGELLELNTDDIKLHPDELLARGEIKQALTPATETQVRQAFERGITIRELIDIISGKSANSPADPQQSIPQPSQPVNTGM